MLLSIFAYISLIAIDLCPALVLSFAVVVRCAVRTLLGGHDPIFAIPNLFGLTRVHMSSWFLLSCISLPIHPPFFRSLDVSFVHGHA